MLLARDSRILIAKAMQNYLFATNEGQKTAPSMVFQWYLVGISFLCYQIGSFVMILLGGVLYDVTGPYTLHFAIAGLFLFPAAFVAFTIQEGKYSARYSGLPIAEAGTAY